jgi:hypothetical protein
VEAKQKMLGHSELLGQFQACPSTQTLRTEIQSAQTPLIRIKEKGAQSRVEPLTASTVSKVIEKHLTAEPLNHWYWPIIRN